MLADYTSTAPGTNMLAIISLALSLAGLPFLCMAMIVTVCGCVTGVFSIGAVVAGLMARQQIEVTGEQGNSMALTGIILGGFQGVLVTFWILISLLFVAISLIGAALSN